MNHVPDCVRYGGKAWLPYQPYLAGESSAVDHYGFYVEVPERVYPVIDEVADNFGAGLVVWTGSCLAVFDAWDLMAYLGEDIPEEDVLPVLGEAEHLRHASYEERQGWL